MFNRSIPAHAHWLFYTFDRKDEIQQTYYGLVQVDVVANSYDEAQRKVLDRFRPRTGDAWGMELKTVTEHLAGTCKN